MECNSIILIEYLATQRDYSLVTDFLVSVLMVHAEDLLLDAYVHLWDITSSIVPPRKWHIITDVMGRG